MSFVHAAVFFLLCNFSVFFLQYGLKKYIVSSLFAHCYACAWYVSMFLFFRNKIPSGEETWQLFYKCCLSSTSICISFALKCMVMTINMWKLIFICCLNISFFSSFVWARRYWIANVSKLIALEESRRLIWRNIKLARIYKKRQIYNRIIKKLTAMKSNWLEVEKEVTKRRKKSFWNQLKRDRFLLCLHCVDHILQALTIFGTIEN